MAAAAARQVQIGGVPMLLLTVVAVAGALRGATAAEGQDACSAATRARCCISVYAGSLYGIEVGWVTATAAVGVRE